MYWLEAPLRSGIGPSGSAPSGTMPAGDELAGDVAGEAEAAVTVTVSAADGGVHFSVVTMLAVGVSFTEVTDAVLAGLALALLLGLLSGLAAMNASREAETVAVAELCDDDADAEPACDGELVGDADAEPVPDGEPVADVDADADDGEPEPGLGLGLGFALDGEGDTGVLLDVLPDAGAVGEAEADGDEPEGDGDGDA